MNMSKLNWTKLQSKIFRLLSVNVLNPLTQREIAKRLKVSPTAVAKSLQGLKKERIAKIIYYNDKVNLTSVELERENPCVVELKRVENLNMLYESELIKFLEENFPGAIIILFGSYSFGEDTINSDIDIAIIGSKERKVNLVKFEKYLERKININNYDNFKEIHKNLRNNILSGIVLVGRVDL